MKTQEEYNQEYGNFCAQIGDKLIAIENLNQQIIEIKKKIVDLAEEAQKAKQAQAVAKEVSNP